MVSWAGPGQEPALTPDEPLSRSGPLTAASPSTPAEHEQHSIGEATLEQLRADLVRLSGLCDTGAPFPAFLDMRRVRERIYRLLDRRARPRDEAGLYFLLSCLHELMGLTANRLGCPDAAEELLRAGRANANVIDHNALRARLSYVMYWRGRYTDSRDLAADVGA